MPPRPTSTLHEHEVDMRLAASNSHVLLVVKPSADGSPEFPYPERKSPSTILDSTYSYLLVLVVSRVCGSASPWASVRVAGKTCPHGCCTLKLFHKGRATTRGWMSGGASRHDAAAELLQLLRRLPSCLAKSRRGESPRQMDLITMGDSAAQKAEVDRHRVSSLLLQPTTTFARLSRESTSESVSLSRNPPSWDPIAKA